MWYITIIILLIHYLFLSGEAGYWLAKKQKEQALKAGFKALFNFLCMVYFIL